MGVPLTVDIKDADEVKQQHQTANEAQLKPAYDELNKKTLVNLSW